MDYELSVHARATLRKRKIPAAWLERVLAVPHLTEPDDEDPEVQHWLARIPEFDNRVLRVLVNTTVSPVRIVSLYFDRRMKKRL